ncbi:hypothetical protein HYY73_02920 [Candidatus Woesearchaeota archaeon]|nr:hypothetical protein [Candidatus Woesearchaeota archaeon]
MLGNSPEGIEYSRSQLLCEAYEAFKDSFVTGAMLDQIGRKIPEYLSFQQHQMVGGYSWFCGLYFRAGNGILSIMLPWMGISQGKKSLERAVEIRKFGEVGSSDVEAIIERLTRLLAEQKRVNDTIFPTRSFSTSQ